MTIAGKINALFISATVLLGCAVTGYTAHREYQIGLNQLVDAALARVLSRPDLQMDIYNQDEASLKQLLGDFLAPRAVSLAVVTDSLGKVLARRGQVADPAYSPPPFEALRVDTPPTEPGLIVLDPELQATGMGLWSSLTAREKPIHLTMPVFSSVNPTEKGLTPLDFATALVEPGVQSSLVVIGYIHLGIDRKEMLRGIRPAVGRVFFMGLALTILCAAIVTLTTRRIVKQLSQLAQLADQVVSGELVEHVEIDGSQEFKDIANVLKGVIGEMSNYRKELDVDHKLLALKVDESASQLSMRNDELNKATEEISKATEEISETKGQLHQMAYYDSLTALPNRRLFTEQLSLLLRLTERASKPLAMLFLNLDNFKRINDSLGHSAGDLLLQEIAKRLVSCLRASDMLAHHVDSGPSIDVSRLGGDEFAMVLNQLDSIESAGLVAQRVIDCVVEPMIIDGHELVVTPSIGITIAPRDAVTVEGLLRAADIAMHHAKTATNRGFLFYNANMDATGLDHLKLESDLRKAVERKELVLHYQPQVDSVDGSIVGAEALLRWEHPEYGQVPPLKFIALAEEIGMIGELGDWVLVEACHQIKAFREQGLALPKVAINVSTFQFNSSFVNRVKEVFQQAELPYSMLELGLSEGILMDNDTATIKALQELKDIGVYLSVDNFGTSYAPLSYLSRNPLDEIKIDRSFVRGCDKREESARLVLAIISMAKSLDLRIVAEGVETEDEYHFLTKNGVHVMQGYLFSKPIPARLLQQQLVVRWHFMGQIQRIALTTQAANVELG